ncbi:MAG: hypothetical protein PHC64_01065 [Candidatus Gastranaerophilales bacterium]|nr:hypothetical protein [Candidatus Gastranaerophilales bacterium]
MLLFILSFLLVFISSYLITSVIAPKKSILGFIYLFLIAFAQLVFTFEVLSLFTAIKEFWVLVFNVLLLVGSIYVWNKKERPLFSLDFKDFRNRIINSLKLDKSLMWLYVAFLVFIIVSLCLCLLFPITNADAQAYHVARSLFWVLQGSLKHFDIADIRNLCLPINSEILYAWIILFVKKDVFLGFFSFVGYLLSIVSLYNILGYCGYCVRKRLWVIFVLSSFASVIVQVSGTETDIIIAGLALSCVFMFWYALKNNKIIPIFMASLAYALAIGTKTTALMAIPGVGVLMLAICFYQKKYKPLLYFLGFGIINFLIFASYNYILNFIHFGDFMGPQSFMVVSKNYYGFKGMIANFIKYLFMMIDFTGFRWSDYLGPTIINIRNGVLNYLHLDYVYDGLYSTPYNVNRMLLEPLMGAGVLGILVFFPCLIWGLIKPIFKFKNKKPWFIFTFAIVFIINLLVMSYLLTYMVFSVRFLMTFIVISSPLLIYSYLSRKNPLKYIIVLFCLFYLICVSTHLWARPFYKIGKILMKNPSITSLRNRPHCQNYEDPPQFTTPICSLINRLKTKFPNSKKILAFIPTSDSIYLLKALEFEGYKIDFRRLEEVKKINFDDYNLIISTDKGQVMTYMTDYEKRKNDYRIEGRKVFFDKSDLVPCFYKPNPNLFNVKDPQGQYPFQVQCQMSRKYLRQKNLEALAIAGIRGIQSDEFGYYVIYANIK